jgi:predicted dehydrogenase
MTAKHILIVGTGSAGKRHGQNLQSLGCKVSCVDPRNDRLDEARQQIPIEKGYLSCPEAIRDISQFDAVAVTSPTSFHVEQATAALERGIPVLLEKPVSSDLDSAKWLQKAVDESGVPLLLGYTWRWWPPLVRVKQHLDQGVVGELRYVRFTMSAHLADWHPWERYQDFFMASKSLGGGALLDESHWLDLMVWFFGMPDKLFAQVEKLSNLEIETDDNVDIFLHYPNGLRVMMHLDLYGRPHEKSIQFVGEGGTLVWTAEPNRIAVGKEIEQNWKMEEFRYERNDMFMAVAKEFLHVLDGDAVKTCTIDDGVRVLSLIEAARVSSQEGRIVKIL